MRYRNTTKFDANHREIVNELRQHGVEVVEIMQPVDLLARAGHFIGLIEIKAGKKDAYTRKQLKFISETRMPIAIVKTTSEALSFLKTENGLTPKQKENIAGFLLQSDAKLWNSEQVERTIDFVKEAVKG